MNSIKAPFYGMRAGIRGLKTVMNWLLGKSASGSIIDPICAEAQWENGEVAKQEMVDDIAEGTVPAGDAPSLCRNPENAPMPKPGAEIEFKGTWVYITYIGIREHSDSSLSAKEAIGGDHV